MLDIFELLNSPLSIFTLGTLFLVVPMVFAIVYYDVTNPKQNHLPFETEGTKREYEKLKNSLDWQ